MSDMLVRAIASRMLLYPTGNEMRLVLQRALQSQAAKAVGRSELLDALDIHLAALLRREATEYGRLRVIAAKCATQLEGQELETLKSAGTWLSVNRIKWFEPSQSEGWRSGELSQT